MLCPSGTVWNQHLKGCTFVFDSDYPCQMVSPRQRGAAYSSSRSSSLATDGYHSNRFDGNNYARQHPDDYRRQPYPSRDDHQRRYFRRGPSRQESELYGDSYTDRQKERNQQSAEREKTAQAMMQRQADGTYEKVLQIKKGKSVILTESAYNV